MLFDSCICTLNLRPRVNGARKEKQKKADYSKGRQGKGRRDVDAIIVISCAGDGRGRRKVNPLF